MSSLKRFVAALAIASLTVAACVCLSGCGKDVAATWSGGTIDEETVTTTITNMRTYYGLEDDEAWAQFVKERTYDQGDYSQTAVEKAAAAAAPSSEEEKPEGTAEDMREYIIEQLIRGEILENEIKSRNIKISDEEVDVYVEQQRAYIESRLMEGVFESVLQRQGYSGLDQYREEIREQLKQLKLQNDVSTVTTEDGVEISGKSAWNIWFDGVYAKANVKINPAPNPLPYAIVETAGESSAESE